MAQVDKKNKTTVNDTLKKKKTASAKNKEQKKIKDLQEKIKKLQADNADLQEQKIRRVAEFENFKKIGEVTHAEGNKYYLTEVRDDNAILVFKNIILGEFNYRYLFYIKQIGNTYTVEFRLGTLKKIEEFNNENDVIAFLKEQFTLKKFLENAFNFYRSIFEEGEINNNKFIRGLLT